jgi:hypothetical protein
VDGASFAVARPAHEAYKGSVTTPVHARYWAHSLLLAHPRDRVEALSRSIGNARVDLNPHQVDAALFALRSPFSRGVLLADEVGLGKTIEAALVLAQRWAERRRRVLLIVPSESIAALYSLRMIQLPHRSLSNSDGASRR